MTMLFAGMSFIFYIICAVGTKADVPWSEYKLETNSGAVVTTQTTWFGLLGSKAKAEVGSVDSGWTYTEYDKDSPQSAVKDCHTAGDVVISFATFGALACIGAILFAQKRKNSGGGGFVRLLSLGANGAGAVFFYIAWTTWVGGCHEKIVDHFDDQNGTGDDVNLHAGFAMALLGSAFMSLGALNELCVANDPNLSG